MFTAGHLVAGFLIGELFVFGTGLSALWALAAIGLGSIVPDLDMLMHHRKTFHSPKIAFGIFGVLFAIYLLPFSLNPFGYLSLFFLGIGVHSVIDIFGGGKEIRAWERNDRRAVFDHVHGHFIEPRWLYYSGSKEDVGFTVVVSLIITAIRPEMLPLLVTLIAASV